MPRQARVQGESRIYHVMVRGNERQDIFLDDEDRIRYLQILTRTKAEGEYVLFAYCLMSNHVHLLIQEKEDSLARSMKRIGVSYSYYFNRKYNRIGHLFQDRYRSEVIDQDSYLLAAARYIHHNPVQACMVSKAEDYEWSSYREYLGIHTTTEALVEREFLLSMFSGDEQEARELLKEYTNQAADDKFMEYQEKRAEIKVAMGDDQLKNSIITILARKGYDIASLQGLQNKEERNSLLQEIKNGTRASVRQLSRVLNLSKDIIFRA